jgi:hypothetical protein
MLFLVSLDFACGVAIVFWCYTFDRHEKALVRVILRDAQAMFDVHDACMRQVPNTRGYWRGAMPRSSR